MLAKKHMLLYFLFASKPKRCENPHCKLVVILSFWLPRYLNLLHLAALYQTAAHVLQPLINQSHLAISPHILWSWLEPLAGT